MINFTVSKKPFIFVSELTEFYDQFNSVLPTTDDVKGAQNALLRLQETFSLSANSIANGIVPQSNKSTKLCKYYYFFT